MIRYFWRLIVKIMRWGIYDLLHLNISEEVWNSLVQFVKFGIIGVSNTVVSYTIYLCCLLGMEHYNMFPQVDYLIAQVIAFFLSVLWSFYWNRKYVFHADTEEFSWPRALLKTYISYAFTGLFLNSILSLIWVNIVHIPKIFAPIVNLLISVPINFLLNKFWAFGDK